MIRDAVWAGLLPEKILEAHFAEVIETATSTYVSALDGEARATAKLCVQKAAQAADEASQQTGAPQLQAQLSRLTDRSRLRRLKQTLLSKGAWQQVIRIEDLCHAQVSHKWLTTWTRAREVSLRRMTTSPMFRGDSATECGWVVVSVDAAAPSLTHCWNMQKPAAQPNPPKNTVRAFTPWSAT